MTMKMMINNNDDYHSFDFVGCAACAGPMQSVRGGRIIIFRHAGRPNYYIPTSAAAL